MDQVLCDGQADDGQDITTVRVNPVSEHWRGSSTICSICPKFPSALVTIGMKGFRRLTVVRDLADDFEDSVDVGYEVAAGV